jgi:hypothetical protein
MFEIKTQGVRKNKYRLIARKALTKSDFKRIASRLGAEPVCARKVGFIAARKAAARETIDTFWNGKETTNTARAGDWIVTSLTPRKTVLRDKDGNPNIYVIRPKTFARLYDPIPGKNKRGRFHKSKSVVAALYLSGGFDILAPWGSRERAPKGYLLLNGKEVYGNNAGTFKATYQILNA